MSMYICTYMYVYVHIHFHCVIQVVLTHCREHRISIGANYATLVINALCLDGMARALVPTYNVSLYVYIDVCKYG